MLFCCLCHVWCLPNLKVIVSHTSKVYFLSSWMNLSLSPDHRIPSSIFWSTGLVVLWNPLNCAYHGKLFLVRIPLFDRLSKIVLFPSTNSSLLGHCYFLMSRFHYYSLLWIWRVLKTYPFDSKIYKMKSLW